jgi:hypothetical protein
VAPESRRHRTTARTEFGSCSRHSDLPAWSGDGHGWRKRTSGYGYPLNERVLCEQAPNDSWAFWWPWKQPIGSVDELNTVMDKLAAVLKSVDEA